VRLGEDFGGRCAAALWCCWSQGGGRGEKQQGDGARSGLIRQARLHWKKGEGEEERGHGFGRKTVSGAGEPLWSRGGRSATVALRGKGRRGQRDRHGRWKGWQGDAWMREENLTSFGYIFIWAMVLGISSFGLWFERKSYFTVNPLNF
jgi:hypothetical protein